MSFRLSPGTLDTMAGIFAPAKRRKHVSGAGQVRSSTGFGVSFAAMAGAAIRPSQAKVAFGSGGAARQSARAVAALDRMARRVPEVVVRITGRQTGSGHVLANFTYISRLGHGENQEVALHTSDGDELHDGRSMQVLAQDWQAWESGDNSRRSGSTSISMILSMPAGVHAVALREAALAFANEEMANRSWVAALHQDRDHPHVHLTIARRDHDGRRFHPDRDDLFRYRQVFAQKLREHGIEANATPARTRGLDPKQDHIGVVKMREKGLMPRVDVARSDRTNRLAEAPAPDPAKGHIAAQQAVIRDVYERSIAELAASPDAEHQAAARSLRSFIAGLPPAEVNSERAGNWRRTGAKSIDPPAHVERPENPNAVPRDPVAAALERARLLRESLSLAKASGNERLARPSSKPEKSDELGPVSNDRTPSDSGDNQSNHFDDLLRQARLSDEDRGKREHDRSRDRDGPTR